jgi:8-oxo-dGTP diphosphatase
VERDGNGWAECERGHSHWGRHGAAGLLLHAVDDAGVLRVLLQHRAAWSHHGDTWGLPGGARDSHEDVVTAALREAVEETGLDPAAVRPRHTFVDDHGGWSYTTVHADTPTPLTTTANRESVDLAWVPVDDVGDRALHPGFAATWPRVRARPTVVLVDTANVLGSRPDGWWRDRAGATSGLLAGFDVLRGAPVTGLRGGPQVVSRVVAVLEGRATAAAAPGWTQVVRAGVGVGGDDVLADTAAQLLAEGSSVVAVTSDRGLRARLESLAGPVDPGSLQLAGPRWLLGLRDELTATSSR